MVENIESIIFLIRDNAAHIGNFGRPLSAIAYIGQVGKSIFIENIDEFVERLIVADNQIII